MGDITRADVCDIVCELPSRHVLHGDVIDPAAARILKSVLACRPVDHDLFAKSLAKGAIKLLITRLITRDTQRCNQIMFNLMNEVFALQL